jgi:hypothetical protein
MGCYKSKQGVPRLEGIRETFLEEVTLTLRSEGWGGIGQAKSLPVKGNSQRPQHGGAWEQVCLDN